MRQRTVLWIFAVVLTVGSAVYQRMTGPSYPVSDSAVIAGHHVKFRLERSHGGESDCPVALIVPDTSVRGVLSWKRFKTDDALTHVSMDRHGDTLMAVLPHQPPAGKLQYSITLQRGEGVFGIPEGEPVVIRFRGDVPSLILIPHVFAMFLAMLLSTRAGLECLRREPNIRLLTVTTVVLLVIGGGILGPIMQKFAFGAYWTGWPFGQDMTDNKTLVALLAWIGAAVAVYRSAAPRRWVLLASIILFAVYLIPHSVLGSELDYRSIDARSGQSQAPADSGSGR